MNTMKIWNNSELNNIKTEKIANIHIENPSTKEDLFWALNKNTEEVFQPNYDLLENQIDTLIKGGKLIKLEKHYWEREVKQRLVDLSKKIQENPDRYGIFNSKWEYSLLWVDGKLIHKKEVLNLLKNSFSEYYKPNMKRALYSTATSVLPLIGFF